MTEEIIFIRDFYWILLTLLALQVFVAFCQYLSPRFPKRLWNNFISVVLITGAALYLGGRSYDIGADTYTYLEFFDEIRSSSNFGSYNELFFYAIMYVFARLFTFEAFLTFIAFVYIGGAYLGMRRFFSYNAVYTLFLFFISPNFFLYGINGIRNGFAASIFILSFYWWGKDNRKMYGAMLLAILSHTTMLIPFLIFIFCKYFKSTKILLLIWCSALLLFFSGFTFSFFMTPLLNSGGYYLMYLSNQANEGSSNIIDFFVYGATPVLAGIYYLYFKKYKDETYLRLLNTYIIANCIYILLLDVFFAVRIAYLSGFLMPVVLAYPLIKERIWPLRFWLLSILLMDVFLIKAIKILFNSQV